MKFSATNIFIVFLFTRFSVSCTENKSHKTSNTTSNTSQKNNSTKKISSKKQIKNNSTKKIITNNTQNTTLQNSSTKEVLYTMPWKDGDTIPSIFIHSKADGKNHSPGFTVKPQALPDQTKFLLLIMVDHHKIAHDWIHWIALVPSSVTLIPENASAFPPEGMEQYANSWGNPKYEGPLPPPGAKHDYHFIVYALKSHPDFSKKPSWQEIIKKIKPVLLKKWEVTAYFGR